MLFVDSYQWPVGVSVSVSSRVKTGILRNDIAPHYILTPIFIYSIMWM